VTPTLADTCRHTRVDIQRQTIGLDRRLFVDKLFAVVTTSRREDSCVELVEAEMLKTSAERRLAAAVGLRAIDNEGPKVCVTRSTVPSAGFQPDRERARGRRTGSVARFAAERANGVTRRLCRVAVAPTLPVSTTDSSGGR